MKITLDQQEIEKAITNYVGNQGIAIADKHINIELHAGRGPNGLSASIDILEAPPEKEKAPKKQARKLAKKEDPVKEEVTQEEETPTEEPPFEEDSAEEPVVEETTEEPVPVTEEAADEVPAEKPLFGN